MDQPILMEGLLVQAQDGRARVILAPYCLDFEMDDVLDIEELPPPADLVPEKSIPVRVKIKSGARLLQISSADPYQDALWRRRTPFALARQSKLAPDHSEMKKREAEFFRARGLAEQTS